MEVVKLCFIFCLSMTIAGMFLGWDTWAVTQLGASTILQIVFIGILGGCFKRSRSDTALIDKVSKEGLGSDK